MPSATAVTLTAPAPASPSATGLSASTAVNAQPTTSGTSATGLQTGTDVSGRAGEPRGAFSVGPETKTSGATGTNAAAAPAQAAGARPMGAGGMPMMPPVAGMGGPGGGGAKDRNKEQTVAAPGSEQSDLMHGRHAQAEAVPWGHDRSERRPPVWAAAGRRVGSASGRLRTCITARVEPITELMRQIDVDDEYAEDLPGPTLPWWAEDYLAEQRAFWRLLRGGGALTEEQQREVIERQADSE